MTTQAIVLMVASVTAVTVLMLWCYAKLLWGPSEPR